MIRLYKETVERILLILTYFSCPATSTLQEIADYVYKRTERYKDASIQLIARRVILEPQGDDLDQIISNLKSQLANTTNGKNEADLLDAVVTLLQLPYARNSFGRDTLHNLRKALLIPEEMSKIIGTLKQRELSCEGCKERLSSEEMVTLHVDRNDAVLYCAGCRKPTLISCGSCPEKVPIDKRLKAAFKKPAQCERCAGGEEVIVETSPTPQHTITEAARRTRITTAPQELNTRDWVVLEAGPPPPPDGGITWRTRQWAIPVIPPAPPLVEWAPDMTTAPVTPRTGEGE